MTSKLGPVACRVAFHLRGLASPAAKAKQQATFRNKGNRATSALPGLDGESYCNPPGIFPPNFGEHKPSERRRVGVNVWKRLHEPMR